jgi:magnesium chelatase subunit D
MLEASQIALQIKNKQIDSLIIDTEKGHIKLGKLHEIADTMGAKYMKIEDLKAESIVKAIR